MARTFDLALDALAVIAASLLLLLIIMVAADVTARALFDSSLTWTFEASEYSLLAIVFLGMPWLARAKGHITVDVFTEMLPRDVRFTLARVTTSLCAILLAWLCFWAVKQAANDYGLGIMTLGIHPIPRFLLPSVTALGLGLTAAEYIRQAVGGRPADESTGSLLQ